MASPVTAPAICRAFSVAPDLTAHIGFEGTPTLELSRWGQSSLQIGLLSTQPGIVTLEGPAVCWRSPAVHARAYDRGDAFEYEVELQARPRTNQLRFHLALSNLVAWYQSSFRHHDPDGASWESNGRGGMRSRPAWANKSYAFYHPFLMGDYSRCWGLYGGWNWGCGKAFHLYRPWAEDANGWRVWCDQVLDGDVLTITIPDGFLAAAVYPVLVDPTFGYTTTGSTDDNAFSNQQYFKATSAPATNGALTSVTVFGRLRFGTPRQNPALYSNTAAAPDARLAFLNTAGTLYGAGDAAVLTNLAYASLGSGVQYWLASKTNTGDIAPATDQWVKFDTNAGATEIYFGNNSPASTAQDWPASATGLSSGTDERVTAYGTYTASGTPFDWLTAQNEPLNQHSKIMIVPSGHMPGRGI